MNKELNPVCFTNDYKYDDKVLIYPAEAEVLNTIANYFMEEVRKLADPEYAGTCREWYIKYTLHQNKQWQEVAKIIDLEKPRVYAFSRLPALIRELSFVQRYDDTLNEEELFILDTMIKRMQVIQRKHEKWALIIPSFENTPPSYNLTKPVIYDILSAESIVRVREYDCYYEWYPTMDELNVLLEKLDEILTDPLVSCFIFAFRKNVIKLIKRLKQYGRDRDELAAD